MDKRGKSLWMLGGEWVHGFQNRTGEETGTRKSGPDKRVSGGVFQSTHSALRMTASESREVCAESVQNRVDCG